MSAYFISYFISTDFRYICYRNLYRYYIIHFKRANVLCYIIILYIDAMCNSVVRKQKTK